MRFSISATDRPLRRGLCRALALLLVTAVAAPAAADKRDPVAADALFRDARKAMTRGDFDTACAKLAESQRLDPAAGTAFNLADCEEKRGHLASALGRWRESIDLLRPGDARRKIATDRATALEPRVPKVALRLAADAPPGTRV